MRNKIVCCNCGASFFRSKSEAAKSKLNFCGRKCYSEFKIAIKNKVSLIGGIPSHIYSSIHQWLIKTFGKATKCVLCGDITKSKYEYALIKGENYDFKKENFIELCCSCHRRYDETDISRANKRNCKIGKVSNNTCPVIGWNNKSSLSFPSLVKASETLNISRTAIHNCLSKISKTSGGYIWDYL